MGLIIVETADYRNAMTVSFFSEVAHYPTTLWISIAPTAYTHTLIQQSGKFTLAVLNRQQKELAIICGQVSGRDRDKCSNLNLYRSFKGFLFLRGALASTGCLVNRAVAIGDHTLFVADIVESQLDSGKAHLGHLLLSDLNL